MKENTTIRILFAEDLPEDAEMARREIAKEKIDFEYKVVDTEPEFRKELNNFHPDIVISDYSMPAFDGMTALKIAREYSPFIPFIVLTGSMNEETAVVCMKAGANDYVIKEQIKRLPFAVKEAFDKSRALKEKKKAEDELKESEEKFRKIFEDHSSAKMLVEAKSGNIIDVNTAAVKLYGWSKKELMQMSIFDFNDTSPDELKERMKKLNADHHISVESKHLLKNGELRDVEIYSSTIEINKEIFYHSIVQDITNRKRFEKELVNAKEKAEENEKRYRSLFLNMMNAFGLHEMIFNENGVPVDYVFLEVNPVWEKVVGMKAEEVIGKSIKEIMPDVEQSWIDKYANIVLTGIPEEFTDYNAATQKYYNVFAYKHHKNKFAVVFNDVTDKKQFESELIRAKEKAEESDRLKSAFLANMSHEIRTPMNGILGFTSLLSEPNLTDKDMGMYVEIIQKSGQRMLDTINDIIEISKIETLQTNISKQETDIVKQLEALVIFFKPECNQKELRLIIENSLNEQERTIYTDKIKIDSILTNLLKNAIKFTETGTITLGITKKAEFLEIYVKDTGVGIPENKLENIFDRFVQAELEISRKYEGSGLGLAITKSYVEMLGGKIWVESKLGQGSTFFFTTPFNPVYNNLSVNEKTSHADVDINKNLNILIVEDDSSGMYYLRRIFKDKCKKLFSATNGIEAIDMVRANPSIDLILMDLKMPEMDGYEATRKIKELNKNVKIIAQTAFALSGDREKAINAGCDDYIEKPIDKNALFELLNRYFI